MVASTVKRVFEKYDTDGSGYLEKAEIWQYAFDTMQEIAPDLGLNYEELEFVFREYDTDQNGMVTQDEMAAYVRTVLVNGGSV